MSQESTPTAAQVRALLTQLKKEYPDARLALDFTSPFELLIALILAAQCTDERVNTVTGTLLFAKYPTPQSYLDVALEELEEDIRPTGFYRNKAKTIRRCCQQLVEEHDSQVPDTIDALVQLHGVGRKTANIVLGNAYGQQAIGVDTHVKRLAQRLGLSTQSDPDKIEHDLTQVLPKRSWTQACHLFQAHGRAVCVARTPKCPECPVTKWCPFPEKTAPKAPKKKRPAFGRKVDSATK